MKKWVWLFFLLTSSSVFATELAQRFDVVRIEGASLPAILGVESNQLFLLSYPPKGEARTVAVQVIQRLDQNGALMLKESKLRETKLLTKRDEIMFMARDLGRRAVAKELPIDARFVVEVEVKDAATQETRYGYLTASHVPPMVGSAKGVGFDAADQSIYGRSYFLRFTSPQHKKAPPFRIQGFAFRTPEAQAGEFSGNILEDNIFRVKSKLFWNLMDVTLVEDDLKADLLGYASGPVAVVRQIEITPDFGSGLFSKPARLTQRFYDNWMETEVETELSSSAMALATSMDLELGEVFSTANGVGIVTVQQENHAFVSFHRKDQEVGFSAWAMNQADGKPLDFVMISESGEASGSTVLRIDLKKQKAGMFHFVIRRFFPPSGEQQYRDAVKAVDQNPLEISVRMVSQTLVLRLPKN